MFIMMHFTQLFLVQTSQEKYTIIHDLFCGIGFFFLEILLFRRHSKKINYSFHAAITIYSIYASFDQNAHYYHVFRVPICPALILFLTGSKWHCLFEGLFRMAIAYIFRDDVILATQQYSGEEVMSAFMVSIIPNIFLLTIILMRFDTYKSEALHSMLAHHHQLQLSENHRVLLLSFSHELRNIANSITGNIELAFGKIVSNEVHQHLSTAKFCTELLVQ